MYLNYMLPRCLKPSGGWAGVPIEIFSVCPSLVSRFPTLCKHGDKKWKWKTYVKPNVNFVNGQRCEAQSYVWCATVQTFGLPLDCQSEKTNALRSLRLSLMSFSCACFPRGRERVSCVGSLMFWVYVSWCVMFVLVFMYICIFVYLYICHTY